MCLRSLSPRPQEDTSGPKEVLCELERCGLLPQEKPDDATDISDGEVEAIVAQAAPPPEPGFYRTNTGRMIRQQC